MDGNTFQTTEYESRVRREGMASARGAVFGMFFGLCFWIGALGCFKLLAYVTTSIRTSLT